MLDWLPTAVAVVLFLGAAAVYLRGSKDKGTIETLERNNRALAERIDILESEAREDHARRAIDHERIRSLEQKNKVLEGIANSSELITAQTGLLEQMGKVITDMNAALTTHHGAAMAAVIQLHEDLETLPERIGTEMRGAQ